MLAVDEGEVEAGAGVDDGLLVAGALVAVCAGFGAPGGDVGVTELLAWPMTTAGTATATSTAAAARMGTPHRCAARPLGPRPLGLHHEGRT